MVRLLVVAVLIAGFTGCSGRGAQPPNGLFGDTSRGSARIQFGDTSQSNLPPTHIRANSISVSFYDPASGTRGIDIGGWIDHGGGSYEQSWLLVLGLYGEPTARRVFPVDTLAGEPSNAPDTAVIIFQDDSVSDWVASSGSVTVQSLMSLRATFSLDAVTLVPRARDVDAMGTFTMSGTFTIANINSVCGLCPE